MSLKPQEKIDEKIQSIRNTISSEDAKEAHAEACGYIDALHHFGLIDEALWSTSQHQGRHVRDEQIAKLEMKMNARSHARGDQG